MINHIVNNFDFYKVTSDTKKNKQNGDLKGKSWRV